MKALFVPDGASYSIELVAESQEDREMLIKYWHNYSMFITCEEWREMSDEAKNREADDKS